MHAGAIEMAGKYVLCSVLRNVSSPGMITIVLNLASAPEVGGCDGSGGDTVEVIPMKIRTTALTTYPYNRIHLRMPMHYCMLWYTAINCTCTILSLTFHQQYHELSHCYRYLLTWRQGKCRSRCWCWRFCNVHSLIVYGTL